MKFQENQTIESQKKLQNPYEDTFEVIYRHRQNMMKLRRKQLRKYHAEQRKKEVITNITMENTAKMERLSKAMLVEDNIWDVLV